MDHGVAHLLAQLRRIPEAAPRREHRGGWIHAARNVALRLRIEMKAKLFVELVVDSAGAKQPAQTNAPAIQHVSQPAE